MKDRLAIVVPVYNEEATVASVIAEWSRELIRLGIDHVLLVLNDGSTDRTGTVLRELAAADERVRVVDKTNSGHGQTCILGYREACKLGVDWVFQIDSDGQCDPKYFEAVWGARSDHLAVFGRRVSRDDGIGRKVISSVCRSVTWMSTGIRTADPNVPYRLMRTDCLAEVLDGFPPDFKLANILVAVILHGGLGRRMGYVPISFRDRAGGEPSVKLLKFGKEGWRLFRDLRRHRGFKSSRISTLRAESKSPAGARASTT